jgi:effector-binding domain-containing protein
MSRFEIRPIPRQATAVVAVRSSLADISDSMGEALQKAFRALAESGVEPAGPPFARYFSMEEPIEYEAGVPVAAPFPGGSEVKSGDIGGIEAAVGMHVGPYDTLAQTYAAMTEWVTTQGRTVAGPMWETYLTDPTIEPDPQRWQTEIFMPVTRGPAGRS